MLEGGSPTMPPGHAAPFYRLRITIAGEGARATFTNLYVPSAQMVRGDEGWMNPPTTTIRALNRVVRGIPPLPAERLSLPRTSDEDAAAQPAAAVPTSSPPSDGDGLPAAVWAFLLAGVAGIVVALAAVTRSALGRRGGSAAAG
jgi:hypothetical protein